MRQAQFVTTAPLGYGAMPDLGLYTVPDGPVANWSELLPLGKIAEARAAQEEAVELAAADIVFVADEMVGGRRRVHRLGYRRRGRRRRLPGLAQGHRAHPRPPSRPRASRSAWQASSCSACTASSSTTACAWPACGRSTRCGSPPGPGPPSSGPAINVNTGTLHRLERRPHADHRQAVLRRGDHPRALERRHGRGRRAHARHAGRRRHLPGLAGRRRHPAARRLVGGRGRRLRTGRESRRRLGDGRDPDRWRSSGPDADHPRDAAHRGQGVRGRAAGRLDPRPLRPDRHARRAQGVRPRRHPRVGRDHRRRRPARHRGQVQHRRRARHAGQLRERFRDMASRRHPVGT